jgi:hypothetical protein
MRDTFLELETTLNDDFLRGNINESLSLHTVEGIQQRYTMCSADQVPSSSQRESWPMHVNQKYGSGSLPV